MAAGADGPSCTVTTDITAVTSKDHGLDQRGQPVAWEIHTFLCTDLESRESQ